MADAGGADVADVTFDPLPGLYVLGGLYRDCAGGSSPWMSASLVQVTLTASTVVIGSGANTVHTRTGRGTFYLEWQESGGTRQRTGRWTSPRHYELDDRFVRGSCDAVTTESGDLQ